MRAFARRVAAIAACATFAASIAGCATTPSPPRDPAARDVALTNPGFEGALTPAGQPHGWTAIQHASFDSYLFAIDDGVRRSGAKSLRIANVGAEPYGLIVQNVPDASLRGRTLRFSAWLRTQDASRGAAGGGVLLLQAMRSGSPIAYEHMRAAAVKGTTDWQRYSITLAIPDNADDIEVGAMLLGPGTLWFDDAMLEVIAR